MVTSQQESWNFVSFEFVQVFIFCKKQTRKPTHPTGEYTCGVSLSGQPDQLTRFLMFAPSPTPCRPLPVNNVQNSRYSRRTVNLQDESSSIRSEGSVAISSWFALLEILMRSDPRSCGVLNKSHRQQVYPCNARAKLHCNFCFHLHFEFVGVGCTKFHESSASRSDPLTDNLPMAPFVLPRFFMLLYI